MKETHLLDEQNVSDWHLVRDNPASVLKHSEDILESAIKLNHTKGIGWAKGNIGAAYMWMSNYEDALNHTIQAKEILSECKDYDHEADISYNLCAVFYFLGDYQKQLFHAKESLKISIDNNYKIGQANAYNGIGLAHSTTENNLEAICYYEKGKKIAESVKNTNTLLKILDGLGQAHLQLENFDKALEYNSQCLHLANKDGSENIASYALNGIGDIYFKKGDAENALINFNKALKLREKLDFKSGLAQTHYHLAETYLLMKDDTGAVHHLDKSVEISNDINSYDYLAKAYLLHAKIAEDNNDLVKHIEFFKAYHNAQNEHNQEAESKKLKTFELNGKLEQIQKENNRLKDYYKDVETMSEIGHEVTSILSITEINKIVYDKVSSLMKVDGFGIGISDEVAGTMSFPGYIENGKVLEPRSLSLGDMTQLSCVCYDKGLDILINNLSKEYKDYIPKKSEPVAGKPSESLIYLPLKVKAKKIGLVTIQSFEKDIYSEYHLNILKNLAIYVSIAIENARLYGNMEELVKERTSELEQNHRNIELLNKIGQDLISTLKFEDVIERLYKNVNILMDASIFGVRLFDEEKNTIIYKYDYENEVRYKEIAVSMEEDNNYSVWCIKNDLEIFINDNETEYSKYVEEVKVVAGDYPQSLIFYPLRRNGKPFGLITVQSLQKNAYTNYHLNIVKTLAHYTQIGLSNAQNYEIIQTEVENRTKELQEANHTIKKKSKDITDSINYAKRIQSALLPGKELMRASFESLFCFYKPKDIVSGDFYWLHDFGEIVVCAVGDCTGHGVPGALMSVLCNGQINKHVKSDSVKTPAEALNLINDGIVETLKQQEVNINSNDGMDIAMCAYNKKTGILNYSGAYRPLVIIRDQELIEFAPNRFSLGGQIMDPSSYIYHTIKLEPTDYVYMFTDGFSDQFGGPKGKKFLSKRFKQLLVDISIKSFDEQQEILENTFNEWMQDNEQVDDILVMGFKPSYHAN